MTKVVNRSYIASPGFNEKQLTRIHEIEQLIKGDYYSPFTHGGKLSLVEDIELNKVSIMQMFLENIREIDACDHMIAIVGDEDKGTAFEIGYFLGRFINADTDLLKPTHYLLLVDDTEGKYSKMIVYSIRNVLKTLFEYETSSVINLDITSKSMSDYIKLGFLFYKNVGVITYSQKELESNVMTSCSTLTHLNNEKEIVDLKKLIMNYSGNLFFELIADKLFNLSHLKLMKKIE